LVFIVTDTIIRRITVLLAALHNAHCVPTYLAGSNRASTKQAEQKQSTLTSLLKTLPRLPFLSSSLKYLPFFANKIETTIPLAAKTLRYRHVLCYPFPLLCSSSVGSAKVLSFTIFFSYGTCLLADDKILFPPSFV